VYSQNEIEGFLEDAYRFARALEEVLQYEKFGLYPLTQVEMNIAAAERLSKSELEMEALTSEVRKQMGEDSDALSAFDDAQQKWRLYRDAQCEFDTYCYRGGTIRSCIWSGEATRLTEDRIEELRVWMKQAY
jgi:uncharacterized protein YecT (DUF1311 family)